MYEEDQTNTNANKPFNEAFEIKRRKEFSHREVGITHPDNNAFFRITDNGCIEIFAAPGIGLIINPNTRSLSLFADSIKFFCKEDDGLRWNDKSFNPASDVYNEPTLIKTSDFSNNPAYNKVNFYLNNIQEFEQNEENSPITIMGRYALRADQNEETQSSETTGFTNEQMSLIQGYSNSHTLMEVEMLKEFILSGYSYDEAAEKVRTNNSPVPENSNNFPWIKNDLEK